MSDKLEKDITSSDKPFFPNSEKVYISGHQHLISGFRYVRSVVSQ